jgi:hypothetical protein
MQILGVRRRKRKMGMEDPEGPGKNSCVEAFGDENFDKVRKGKKNEERSPCGYSRVDGV